MDDLQIRSLLVGVDLSTDDGPDPVLVAAARLADAVDAELHLAHAVESGPIAPPLLPTLAEEMEMAARALDLYLDDALPPGAETASHHIGLGRAHRVLADRAAELDVDLVVVGAHREGPVEWSMLGTSTDRLLRTLTVPCWIARGPLQLPLRRLTAATDFSDLSRPALEWAFVLADRLGPADDAGAGPPELDVLHVEWPAALRDDPAREEQVLRPDLDDEIASAEQRTGLARAAVTHPRVVAAVDPSRGILTHAAQEKPDVVVLGTHGRGALARALLGSVASVVAREAEGHVMLVPPRTGSHE